MVLLLEVAGGWYLVSQESLEWRNVLLVMVVGVRTFDMMSDWYVRVRACKALAPLPFDSACAESCRPSTLRFTKSPPKGCTPREYIDRHQTMRWPSLMTGCAQQEDHTDGITHTHTHTHKHTHTRARTTVLSPLPPHHHANTHNRAFFAISLRPGGSFAQQYAGHATVRICCGVFASLGLIMWIPDIVGYGYRVSPTRTSAWKAGRSPPR